MSPLQHVVSSSVSVHNIVQQDIQFDVTDVENKVYLQARN